MATWNKNTILLAASEVQEGDSPTLSSPLTEQWLYKFGEGWTSLGPIGKSDV